MPEDFLGQKVQFCKLKFNLETVVVVCVCVCVCVCVVCVLSCLVLSKSLCSHGL